MENPRRVVVAGYPSERTVEIVRGPYRLFANVEMDYYTGWLELEGQDPYGEPRLVNFPETEILREA